MMGIERKINMLVLDLLKQALFFIIGVIALTTTSFASNLQLSNLDQVAVDTNASTITFSLSLKQDKSWRNQTNFDAVWLFMKYSTDGGATWKHASMAGKGVNPSGYSIPSQLKGQFEIAVPSDQRGFFVERSAYGNGSISLDNLKFVWSYGSDGLSAEIAQSPNTLLTIYGIEMVYIPQGAFYAGDGSTNTSTEYALSQGSSVSTPWYIQNENAIQLTNAASGSYYYQNTGARGDEFPSGSAFTIPASFPKGFNAFYLMKYQLTEGQWVSFFNTLSSQAKPYRDITSGNLKIGGKNSQNIVNRNTISWNAAVPTSKAKTLRPLRPVSYVSWPDVAAYAAWSGLRPMSELEYEKAARGSDIPAVPGEFVWGTTSITSPNPANISSSQGEEDGTETLSDVANINSNPLGWSSGDGRAGGIAEGQPGPLRIGIFEDSTINASNPRVSWGAGYYGNMELSGNLAEPVVTVGRPEGLNFHGTHGTGNLTELGFAANADWPGIDSNISNGVTGTVGTGYKGGDFQSPSTIVYATSARTYAVKDPDSQACAQRYDAKCGVFQGARLARSAS